MRSLSVSTTLLLLFAVVAAAGQPSIGTIDGTAASGSGAVAFGGTLHGLGAGLMPEFNTEVTRWNLNASSIHTTKETVQATVYAESTKVRSDSDIDSTTRTLQQAVIRATGANEAAYVFVLGDEATVSVRASELDVQPMQAGEAIEPLKYEDQRPRLAATWDRALDVSSKEATVTVEGAFTVGVWGVALDVEHDEGRESWVTGRHDEQHLDPDGNVVVADETWIYLKVEDGRLTLPGQQLVEGSLVAAPGASLAVEGSMQVRSAHGEVLGHVLEGEDVTVSGSLAAPGIIVGKDRLALEVIGDADSYVLDGRLVAVSPGQGSVSWLWSFAAVPVLAAWLVRRQQPARRVARLREALGRGRYSGVARRAPRLFGTPWDREARIATAVAYLRLDAPDQAMGVLEEGDVPHGMTCFLRAHARAIMGQLSEARALLREALATSPHLRPEAERNPSLAPLLSMGATEAYA